MQNPSLKEKAHDEVRRLVNEFVEMLKRKFRLRLALLFGSWATGKATLHSDVDLLVVADDLSADPRENIVILKLRGKFSRISCLGYRTEDFLDRLERLSFVILDAVEEGEMIYQDEGLLPKIREIVKRLKEEYKLRKVEKAWLFISPI